MSDIEEGTASAKKPWFFVRLFRGDVGLALTFWVFGVIVNILLFIAIIMAVTVIVIGYIAVNLDAAEGSAKPIYYSILYGALAVATAYNVFIYIAIWRSARKYAGFKLWKVLAQILVILGWLNLPFSLYGYYINMTYENVIGESESEFRAELEAELESLEAEGALEAEETLEAEGEELP